MDQIEVNVKVMVDVKVQVKLIVEVKFKDINAIVKIWNLGVPKTTHNITIKIKMQNFIQEPSVFFKSTNLDFNDTYVLCTSKIKLESKTWEHDCTKDHWPYPNQDQDSKHKSKTSSIL